MLMLPFIGLIVSLTLWGTFVPVPFTNINPHESFVGRLGGAFKAAYVTTGAYELVHTVSNTASGYGHVVVDDFPVLNDTSPVFAPTSTWEGARFVRELRTVDAKRPSRTTSGGVGSDSSAPVESARGFVAFVIGALVFVLFHRLGLVSYSAYTLGELVEELGSKLFGPGQVVYHLEFVDPTDVLSLDAIVEMVEKSRAPVEGGIASFYPSCDASMFTHSLAYRPPPQPCQALVLFQRPVVSPVVQEDFLTFHHVADEAISSLVRLRGDEDVKDLGFCTAVDDDPKEDTIPDVTDSSPTTTTTPASADVLDFGTARLPQTKALVLFRLENLSHFVVYQLVCALLASWESHTTAVTDPTPVDDDTLDQQVPEACEVGSETEEAPTKKKKTRSGQKTRRRKARAELREQQAALVAKLEAESGVGATPPSPPPSPAPVPPAAPTQSKGPSAPVPEPAATKKTRRGKGRLSRPPNLPPLPQRQQGPPSPAPSVSGGGSSEPVQPPPAPAAQAEKKIVVRLPPSRQEQGQGSSVPPAERGLYMHPNSRHRPS
ncbi:hypothetical protein FQN54_003579 [Arachnomyces sp. PD_36]|nr:hypothetical protein FQN54_003579 [Arachnomyces sp. PD_36]